MPEQKSLFKKMCASSANDKQSQAIFQFLRDVEMLDREWGNTFVTLRQAKEAVLQNMKGNVAPFICQTVEVLYDLLDSGQLPTSAKSIIKQTLSSGRKLVDLMS